MGGKARALPPPCPWVVLKLLQSCETLPIYSSHPTLVPTSLLYCKSLVTSCCTLFACANAAMPVWLRISYFDMFEVAAA